MGLFSAICWVEGGANLLIQRSVESNEGSRSHWRLFREQSSGFGVPVMSFSRRERSTGDSTSMHYTYCQLYWLYHDIQCCNAWDAGGRHNMNIFKSASIAVLPGPQNQGDQDLRWFFSQLLGGRDPVKGVEVPSKAVQKKSASILYYVNVG